MTVKEFLEQAWEIDRRIKLTLEKVEKMRESVYCKKPTADGAGGSGGMSDSMGRAIAKYLDYERQADELVDKLVDTKIKIEKVIATVPDAAQREVLERRYLLYQKFESKYDRRTGELIRKGIADTMNYSVRWVYGLHDKAIEFLENNAVKFIEFQKEK